MAAKGFPRQGVVTHPRAARLNSMETVTPEAIPVTRRTRARGRDVSDAENYGVGYGARKQAQGAVLAAEKIVGEVEGA
jgi:hypothetical protein